MSRDGRTSEQLTHHYQVEKELANRLKRASREQRRHLYSGVYDELLRRVTDHPLLSRKSSDSLTSVLVESQMRFLRRFLTPTTTFLELGPGDCALSMEVAKVAKRVYAVDVSDEISKRAAYPSNFSLILSDGCSVPVSQGTVNVAYSNQLMEHLHPDDALEQLRKIFTALAPGGIYICITPNRLNGPHDISKYFDDVATGLHLKEYTTSDLRALFDAVGFSRIQSYADVKSRSVVVPNFVMAPCEAVLGLVPRGVGKFLARTRLLRALLGVRLVAVKRVAR